MPLHLGLNTSLVRSTVSANERVLTDAARKLSSGKRIEGAADDAAGSQISETFTSQIKGYVRAARNAYSGMNLARQADVALDEINQVLHNIKALAVQSASDTLTQNDRNILQMGAQQFVDEIQSIGQRTDFAGTPLLDGSFMKKAIHIGKDYQDAIELTLEDSRSSYLGRYAVLHSREVNKEALNTGDIFINDARVRASLDQDDTVSTTLNAASAIAKAAAINDASAHSNVAAFVNQTQLVSERDIAGGDLIQDNLLQINGVTIVAPDVVLDDGTDVLVRSINLQVKRTGVVAKLSENSRLVLTAEDGRNIEIKTGGDAHTITGLNAGETTSVKMANLTLFSDDFFKVSDRTGMGGEARIGVDENEMLGAHTLDVVSTIDISTRRGANRAMTIVDRATEAILASRARMGGVENRLEFTVNRLNEASRTAYQARSKIVDSEFVTETARLARGQMLRDAFTTILAQANQSPSQVLQLL